MTRRRLGGRRGVTLIEMLVAMSVSGLVLIAVLGIMGFSTRRLGSETGRAQTIMIANGALNAMCKEIHNSISVQNDSNGNPTEFTLPANTDAAGNYIPTIPNNGSLGYQPGVTFAYQLSNSAGSATSGTCLWRYQFQAGGGGGGLLGGLLGLGGSSGTWVADKAWSQMQSGKAGAAGVIPQYPNVSSLTFSTTSLPANTVRVTLVVSEKEGGQTSTYTLSRCVYLANHN